jgi:hypothetical protein
MLKELDQLAFIEIIVNKNKRNSVGPQHLFLLAVPRSSRVKACLALKYESPQIKKEGTPGGRSLFRAEHRGGVPGG